MASQNIQRPPYFNTNFVRYLTGTSSILLFVISLSSTKTVRVPLIRYSNRTMSLNSMPMADDVHTDS